MSRVLYANAMGSLMYIMVCTRPNLAYAVSDREKTVHEKCVCFGFLDTSIIA